MPIEHGYDSTHMDQERPFQPQARWQPASDCIIKHDGEYYAWVHNVTAADMAREEVQQDYLGRNWILADPRPTEQRTTGELLEMGFLSLCVRTSLRQLGKEEQPRE